jgi:hypothetical protein
MNDRAQTMKRVSGRDELHVLIDQLPPDQIAATLRFIHDLQDDPVLLSLLNAPADDEPYTDEQRERDARAMASVVEGGGIAHEDILREFGLKQPK